MAQRQRQQHAVHEGQTEGPRSRSSAPARRSGEPRGQAASRASAAGREAAVGGTAPAGPAAPRQMARYPRASASSGEKTSSSCSWALGGHGRWVQRGLHGAGETQAGSWRRAGASPGAEERALPVGRFGELQVVRSVRGGGDAVAGGEAGGWGMSASAQRSCRAIDVI